MEKLCVIILLVLSLLVIAVPEPASSYYSDTISLQYSPVKEKKTNLHFFLHESINGDKPAAVIVARANLTGKNVVNGLLPFGTVYVLDGPLTLGPEITSKVIGNARGIYVATSRDKFSPTLLMDLDFGFTDGKFNGSSFSVMSRNPVTEPERELAVVGGRGRFRMARGFAELRTFYFNTKNGDGVIEYNVTLFHY